MKNKNYLSTVHYKAYCLCHLRGILFHLHAAALPVRQWVIIRNVVLGLPAAADLRKGPEGAMIMEVQ